MSAYNFFDPDGLYFVTLTVVEWIDVFRRKQYAYIIIESLKHCISEKRLGVYGWCIMSSHLHLIISRKEGGTLKNLYRNK